MMYVVLVPAWLWVALQAGMILSAGVATFAAMVVVKQRKRELAERDKAPGPIEP